jgi:hypothetical protein
MSTAPPDDTLALLKRAYATLLNCRTEPNVSDVRHAYFDLTGVRHINDGADDACATLRRAALTSDPELRRQLVELTLDYLETTLRTLDPPSLEEELEEAARYDEFLRENGWPLDDEPFPKPI